MAVNQVISKKAKNAILIALFAFVLPVTVVLDRWAGRDTRQHLHTQAYGSVDRRTYHGKQFTVVKVVDGDTVDIDLPDGEYKTTRIRLLGVDTPETKSTKVGVMYFGPEASEFATNTLHGKIVTVLLDTVAEERDRYGRLLGYIKCADGQVFNEMLVKQGYAYADLRFDHYGFESYRKMMDNAVGNKVGL